ncbi:hypothetical protein [Mumia sp. DW29H23]|uniref:hypothetical protein n=1 Tax=Mumia sp. DW29H23 TaxID=3421241 RepID=UPI003D69AC2B
MSTRKERKNRWWLRCPGCGGWKGSTHGERQTGPHFDPFTKTYVCSTRKGIA